MKKFSKLLALLLALALVFSLVACSTDKDDDDDEDDKKTSSVDKNKDDDKDDDKDDEEEEEELTDEEMIVGEWICRFDMGEAMSEMLAEALGEESIIPDEAVYMDLTLEFDDEQLVLTMELDKDSLKDYMKELVDAMVDYMYEMAEEEGMSKEDFDAMIEEEAGMSVEDYVDAMMEEAMEGTFDEMSYEADPIYYRVDAKKGYIYVAEDEDDLEDSEEYMEYSVTEKKLTIKEMEGDAAEELEELEALGMDLPWKFEKQ